ncbi:hypothetical protein KUCAC02_025080, partial [Chaenocephalus aceratus]
YERALLFDPSFRFSQRLRVQIFLRLPLMPDWPCALVVTAVEFEIGSEPQSGSTQPSQMLRRHISNKSIFPHDIRWPCVSQHWLSSSASLSIHLLYVQAAPDFSLPTTEGNGDEMTRLQHQLTSVLTEKPERNGRPLESTLVNSSLEPLTLPNAKPDVCRESHTGRMHRLDSTGREFHARTKVQIKCCRRNSQSDPVVCNIFLDGLEISSLALIDRWWRSHAKRHSSANEDVCSEATRMVLHSFPVEVILEREQQRGLNQSQCNESADQQDKSSGYHYGVSACEGCK